MAGVCKVILLGHLGRDPEMRYLPNGTAVATLNIATTEAFKDRDGNRQERTEWHRVVLWARQAEIASEYLRKGSQAYIEGRLQTRKWTDKDGNERYTTEIRGDRLQLIGGRRDDTQEPQASNEQIPGGGGGDIPQAPLDEFEDIPFITMMEPMFQPRHPLARIRWQE